MVESQLVEVANIVAQWSLELIKQHGIIVGILVVLGIFSIVGAIFSQSWKVLRLIFITFVAIPGVIIVALFEKKERKKRLEELGQIKAFLKENPDRMKKTIIYILYLIFTIIVLGFILWAVNNFVLPLRELNEYSKMALENYSTNFSNISN